MQIFICRQRDGTVDARTHESITMEIADMVVANIYVNDAHLPNTQGLRDLLCDVFIEGANWGRSQPRKTLKR